MSSIRNAREFCFQFFFHLQLPIFEGLRENIIKDNDLENLKLTINEFKETSETPYPIEHENFILNCLSGTLKNYHELEGTISKFTVNWKVNRLPKVDYTNLLLSAWELLYYKKTTPGIVINEAVEIAKKYGTEDSPSFINGILDKMVKNVSAN